MPDYLLLSEFTIDLLYFAVLVFQDALRVATGGLLAGSIIYSLVTVTIFMIRSR